MQLLDSDHHLVLEKELATHSSILAWRTPWTEKPGRLEFMGSKRVGHDWSDLAHMHHLVLSHYPIAIFSNCRLGFSWFFFFFLTKILEFFGSTEMKNTNCDKSQNLQHRLNSNSPSPPIPSLLWWLILKNTRSGSRRPGSSLRSN